MTRQIEEVWGTRDEETWEKAMRDLCAETLQAAEAWRAKWPNHCRACKGWGGFAFIERHGFTHGAGEQMFDACGEGEETLCHRCGAHGMPDNGDGPCKECGWHYDDGEPEIGL